MSNSLKQDYSTTQRLSINTNMLCILQNKKEYIIDQNQAGNKIGIKE